MTSNSITQSDRLVDYVVVLGMCPSETGSGGLHGNADIVDDRTMSGKVLQRFPITDWPDSSFNPEIVHFCQPRGWRVTARYEPPTFLMFVLTDLHARRQYCACLSFFEPYVVNTAPAPGGVDDDGDCSAAGRTSSKPVADPTDVDNDAAGSAATCEKRLRDTRLPPGSGETLEFPSTTPRTMYVPKSIVIISQYDMFDTFKNCLTIIYTAFIDGTTISAMTAPSTSGDHRPSAVITAHHHDQRQPAHHCQQQQRLVTFAQTAPCVKADGADDDCTNTTTTTTNNNNNNNNGNNDVSSFGSVYSDDKDAWCRDELNRFTETASDMASKQLEVMVGKLIGGIKVPRIPGSSSQFSLGTADKQTIYNQRHPEMPCTDTGVSALFDQLGINNVLSLFKAVLIEMKILIVSRSFCKLTEACRAIEAMIYPLRYCHVFIPVLPANMLDVIEAPTPYLIGVHSDHLSYISTVSIENLLLVNLDMACLDCIPESTSLPAIPGVLQEILIGRLLSILKPVNPDRAFTTPSKSGMANGHEYSRRWPHRESVQSGETFKDKCLRAAFLKFFVELLSDYRMFLMIIRVNPIPIITFQKSKYLSHKNFLAEAFINRMIESMLFHRFIEERGVPFRTRDIFDQLCKSDDQSIEQLATALLNNEPKVGYNGDRVPCRFTKPSKPFPVLDTKFMDAMLRDFADSSGLCSDVTRHLSCRDSTSAPSVVDFNARSQKARLSDCSQQNQWQNNHRVSVLRQCLKFIFDEVLSEASKLLPAVAHTLQVYRESRRLLCEELTKYSSGNKKASLSDKQFDLLIELLDAALDADDLMVDEYGVAYCVLSLSSSFCHCDDAAGHRLFQFTHTKLRHRPIWANLGFWQMSFYTDLQTQLVLLYSSRTMVNKLKAVRSRSQTDDDADNNGEYRAEPTIATDNAPKSAALAIVAEHMRTRYMCQSSCDSGLHQCSLQPQQPAKDDVEETEEMTICSLALHYLQRIVDMQLSNFPIDLNVSSKSDRKHSLSKTDSQNCKFDAQTGKNRTDLDEVAAKTSTFCRRFLERMSSETALSEAKNEMLLKKLEQIVQVEHEQILNISGAELHQTGTPIKLGSTSHRSSDAAELLTQLVDVKSWCSFLHGEHILHGPLRCLLVQDDPDNYVLDFEGSNIFPCDGVCVLTNFRVLFVGKPVCLSCRHDFTIRKSLPVSSVTKIKVTSARTADLSPTLMKNVMGDMTGYGPSNGCKSINIRSLVPQQLRLLLHSSGCTVDGLNKLQASLLKLRASRSLRSLCYMRSLRAFACGVGNLVDTKSIDLTPSEASTYSSRGTMGKAALMSINALSSVSSLNPIDISYQRPSPNHMPFHGYMSVQSDVSDTQSLYQSPVTMYCHTGRHSNRNSNHDSLDNKNTMNSMHMAFDQHDMQSSFAAKQGSKRSDLYDSRMTINKSLRFFDSSDGSVSIDIDTQSLYFKQSRKRRSVSVPIDHTITNICPLTNKPVGDMVNLYVSPLTNSDHIRLDWKFTTVDVDWQSHRRTDVTVRLSTVNAGYCVCQSYPYVVPVIASLSDDAVRRLAKMYRMNRFPLVCWKDVDSRAMLLRSAQLVLPVAALISARTGKLSSTSRRPYKLFSDNSSSKESIMSRIGSDDPTIHTYLQSMSNKTCQCTATAEDNPDRALCCDSTISSRKSSSGSMPSPHIAPSTQGRGYQQQQQQQQCQQYTPHSLHAHTKANITTSSDHLILDSMGCQDLNPIYSQIDDVISINREDSMVRRQFSNQANPNLNDDCSISFASITTGRLLIACNRDRLNKHEWRYVIKREDTTNGSVSNPTCLLPVRVYNHQSVRMAYMQLQQSHGDDPHASPKANGKKTEESPMASTSGESHHIALPIAQIIRSHLMSGSPNFSGINKLSSRLYGRRSKTFGGQSSCSSTVSFSNWLHQIHDILNNSMCITRALRVGTTVLVSLEDGQTATSQLSSLSQLLVDPYYRTLAGFVVLVQKEWLDAGHRFNDRDIKKIHEAVRQSGRRGGRGRPISERVKRKQRSYRSSSNLGSGANSLSPYFLQFLDAVHQLLHNFPTAFEFNDYLLRFLAYHTYSDTFHQFILNDQQSRQVCHASNTRYLCNVDIWDYVLRTCELLPIFQNIMFDPSDSCIANGALAHGLSIHAMDFWSYHSEDSMSGASTYADPEILGKIMFSSMGISAGPFNSSRSAVRHNESVYMHSKNASMHNLSMTESSVTCPDWFVTAFSELLLLNNVMSRLTARRSSFPYFGTEASDIDSNSNYMSLGRCLRGPDGRSMSIDGDLQTTALLVARSMQSDRISPDALRKIRQDSMISGYSGNVSRVAAANMTIPDYSADPCQQHIPMHSMSQETGSASTALLSSVTSVVSSVVSRRQPACGDSQGYTADGLSSRLRSFPYHQEETPPFAFWMAPFGGLPGRGVTMQGLLKKRSQIFKQWQEKWFVLDEYSSTLYYMPSTTNKRLTLVSTTTVMTGGVDGRGEDRCYQDKRRTISLNSLLNARLVPPVSLFEATSSSSSLLGASRLSTTGQCCFQLLTDHKTYTLMAESRMIAQEWVNALRMAAMTRNRNGMQRHVDRRAS